MILSLSVINKSPVQDQTHQNHHIPPTDEMTPGFKPFTVIITSYFYLARGNHVLSQGLNQFRAIISTYFPQVKINDGMGCFFNHFLFVGQIISCYS